MEARRSSEHIGAGKTGSKQACLACRKIKTKCRIEPSAKICERCLRNSLECVFQDHRRGRRPGTRILKRDTASTSPRAATRPAQILTGQHVEVETSPRAALTLGVEQLDRVASLDPSPGSELSERATTSKNIWEAALQPEELLTRNATTGMFSLQHVLSADDSPFLQGDSGSNEKHSGLGLDDPIQHNLVNFPIALGLFDCFMRSLNPFVSQLDPDLHTFEYVQTRSSFLLTTVLAAASRAFHPSLHAKLRAHSEALLSKAIAQGTKSTETIQAILISTYWKNPEDTRSFLLVGYAIRMCHELGWHRLGPESRSCQNSPAEVREARNVLRTWLVIFVYDRSISLQMNKPTMIEQSNFITFSHDWYKQPHAIFGADALLCAFVSLRIMSSEMLQMVLRDRARLEQSTTLNRMLNNNLSLWEETWLAVAEDDRLDPRQAFLIRFYGLHLRLLLNSFSLRDSLDSVDSTTQTLKEVLWTCYTSAIDMLEQISDKFGPLKLLYFAQDSVHVMTAYAAVFLIKLLLIMPSPLSKEIEASSIEAISKTAKTFQSQSATQETACALQARFLHNVVAQYQSARSRATTPAAKRSSQTQQEDGSNVLGDRNKAEADGVNIVQPSHGRCIQEQVNEHDSAKQDVPYQGTVTMDNDKDSRTWTFDDNEQWEQLFASAGFSINDGIFMPSDHLGGALFSL